MNLICMRPEGRKVYSTDLAEAVVGRVSKTSEADVQIEGDASISRRQAKIWREGDDIWIEDLGSTWGTRVNGTELDAPRKITESDRVQMGDTILVIAMTADTAFTDTPPSPLESVATDTMLPKHLRRDD